MPAYLIQHPHGKQRDDVLLEDPALTLTFEAGWAVFKDPAGICLALPAGHDAHIQRVDEPEQDTATDSEPAPRKE